MTHPPRPGQKLLPTQPRLPWKSFWELMGLRVAWGINYLFFEIIEVTWKVSKILSVPEAPKMGSQFFLLPSIPALPVSLG